MLPYKTYYYFLYTIKTVLNKNKLRPHKAISILSTALFFFEFGNPKVMLEYQTLHSVLERI